MFPEVDLRSNSSSTPGFIELLLTFSICENKEYGRIFWYVFTMLCFALGFPAYIVILYEWYKTYKNGSPLTPNTFFMLNLSVMDFVFLVFLPAGLLNNFIWHVWMVEAIWNGIYALSVCGRPLLMACICVDCYLAVVHPLVYRKWTSLTPRIVMAGFVWLLTFVLGVAFGIFYTLYTTLASVMPSSVSVVIIIICDGFILYTLMKTVPGGKNLHPQKQRAIHTLINSLVIAVVSYIPPLLLYTIGKALIHDANVFYCSVSTPMTVFSTVGSAVMPLLFLHNLGKFDRFKLWCKRMFREGFLCH